MQFSRSWLIITLVLALLVTAISSCAHMEQDDGEADLEVVTIQRGPLTISTTATGSVLPGAEVTLSFEVSGQVTDVLVQAGARVQIDQALAQLDTSDLELQVRSAVASLASAQAQLDQLKAGPQPEEVAAAEANLAAAEAALTGAAAERQRVQAGTLDAEIAAAEAQVASALSQQKIAQIAHDNTMECRTIKIPGDGEKKICPGLGEPEEQARFNLHAADVALEAAQKQLQALRDSADFQVRALWANEARALGQRDAAQAQLDLLLAGTTGAQIAAAEASVDQAQVALDSARLALERATLKSPFDGIISRVDVEVGESVGPQIPTITLVDDSRFRVEADVDEADIGRVELGQEVQITLDAFPGRVLTGTVTAIAPSGEFDTGIVSYLVTIEIGGTDLSLRGGMTANTEIIQERHENVLLVPNRAIWIDAETGKLFVERMVDGEIVTALIEQGVTNDQVSEVLSGLEDGDQLVVRSASVRDRFRSVVTMPMTGQE